MNFDRLTEGDGNDELKTKRQRNVIGDYDKKYFYLKTKWLNLKIEKEIILPDYFSTFEAFTTKFMYLKKNRYSKNETDRKKITICNNNNNM